MDTYVDEASLILEVLVLKGFDIFQPLGYNQVAPILFLVILKVLSVLFGSAELVFRIFPYACYLASLFFLFNMLRHHQLSRRFLLLALFLTGSNWLNLYYAGIAKQYIVDVFVFVMLISLTVTQFYRRKPVLYVFICACTIFLSHISIVILTSVAAYLLYGLYVNREDSGRVIAFLLPVTGIFFLLNYFIFIKSHPTTDHMNVFWENAFLPLNVFSITPYAFLVSEFNNIWGEYMYGPLLSKSGISLLPFISGLVFSVCGCYSLFRKNQRGFLWLLASPVFIHILLSGLKLYPFSHRFILYLFPSFIIIYLVGIKHLLSLLPSSPVTEFAKRTALSLVLVVYCISLLILIPIKNSQVKEALEYIITEKTGDDAVFYDHPSWRIMEYYLNYHKIGQKFASESLVWFEASDDFLALDEFNAAHVRQRWVILSDNVDIEIFQDSTGQLPWKVDEQKSRNFRYCTVICYN